MATRKSTKIERTCGVCGKIFFALPSRIARGWGRFCSINCRSRNNSAVMQQPVAKRFWEKVHKTDTCWLWTGATVPDGYGSTSRDGRYIGAHRLSWELHFGVVPEGLYVLHNCPGGDNKRCVNPAHLWIGTQQDNSADAVRKGQLARGEEAGRAKLTDRNVLDIRHQYASRTISQRKLAKEFGVSKATIHAILTERTWRHLLPAE